MNTKERGEVAEALAIYRLRSMGYQVSEPFGDSARYDLIVDDGSSLYRCQVKRASPVKGTVKFRPCSRNIRTGDQEVYTKQEIDGFIASAVFRDDIYYIPVEEATKSEMRLRISETKNGQSKGVNWAEDYRITSP